MSNKQKPEWYVYRYNTNATAIYKYNVFNHGGFLEDVENLFKLIKKRQITHFGEFSEQLRQSAMYWYWCKAEHEVVITSFPPYITREEYDRIGVVEGDFKRIANVNLRTGMKVDIYSQLLMNWDAFARYVWDFREEKENNPFSDVNYKEIPTVKRKYREEK